MNIEINKTDRSTDKDRIIIINKDTDLTQFNLSEENIRYIRKSIENNGKTIKLNERENIVYLYNFSAAKELYISKEDSRLIANELYRELIKEKITDIEIINTLSEAEISLAFLEGLLLTNYSFDKYKSKKKEKYIKSIKIIDTKLKEEELQIVINNCKAVYKVRDLVNEPHNYLTATKLGEEFKAMAEEAGFEAVVYDKEEIKNLELKALLAVNKGSTEPPVFCQMTWKPENAKNEKPYVFIGKGIVYDSGGLSLKKTANSMDFMKSDMGGAAAVGGLMYAVAKNNIPLYVIGLVPSTDNMLSPDSYAPGDIIETHKGISVEVLNTDAEGRLILADALSFAKKFEPELVIDTATLTGSAIAALGYKVAALMGNNSKYTKQLINSSLQTWERLAEFPMFDDYKEQLKSTVADITNLGREAGVIVAGKFLEYFVDYPWYHIDIAGPSFNRAEQNYKGVGSSGFGVRLLFDFLYNLAQEEEHQ